MVRTLVATVVALVFFAANSLLCRAALGNGLADAGTFTLVRLASGAICLVVLARGIARPWREGRWASAVALFAYAAAFSWAYLRIGAGTGALVLFGSVQVTMIGWGLVRGDRPSAAEWLGLGTSIAGLVVLTFPGLRAPEPIGTALMAIAGIAWGVYSLRGRTAVDPLATTAGNFLLATPFAIALAAARAGTLHVSGAGVALAVASGAVASGIGYAFWYAALPKLSATRAAIAQLSVPVLAASGGVALLGEDVTSRFLLAAALVLGGLAVAIFGKTRRAA